MSKKLPVKGAEPPGGGSASPLSKATQGLVALWATFRSGLFRPLAKVVPQPATPVSPVVPIVLPDDYSAFWDMLDSASPRQGHGVRWAKMEPLQPKFDPAQHAILKDSGLLRTLPPVGSVLLPPPASDEASLVLVVATAEQSPVPSAEEDEPCAPPEDPIVLPDAPLVLADDPRQTWGFSLVRKPKGPPLPRHPDARVLTRDEWLREGIRLFGRNKLDWTFRCPACGQFQSVHDFLVNGVSPQGRVFQTCLGVYLDVGSITTARKPCRFRLLGRNSVPTVYVLHGDQDVPVLEFMNPMDPEFHLRGGTTVPSNDSILDGLGLAEAVEGVAKVLLSSSPSPGRLLGPPSPSASSLPACPPLLLPPREGSSQPGG